MNPPTSVPVGTSSRLEPWPPPRATEYAVFADVARKQPTARTVGDIDDALRSELNASGHYKLRYWGAPGGFSLVVPLEPIDGQGRPVAGAQEFGAGGWGGVVEEIWNAIPVLMSGPVRRYRILLFILTHDEKVRHSQASMTADTGDDWDARGALVLPKIDRSAPVTSEHIAAIFVYEFEKTKTGDFRMLDKSNLSAAQHLRSTNVKWLLP